jgi:ubiquinone/menaquinone biosynthesis C-methylase UbiE
MSLVDRLIARLWRRRHPTPLQYWENRVRAYGPRSVLHVAHANEDIEEITKMQEREIFPHFRSQLNGHEKIALDFGCGPGRFTVQLAEMINGEAIGLDPMQALLGRAPKSPNVNYRCVRSKTLPFADDSFDVIWCCLVMGGIAQPEDTILELSRVLRPKGLMFVVENTSETPDGEFWKYRSVEHYFALFSFAKLAHLHDYIDVGERISILAGRKSEFHNLTVIADAT